MVLAALCCTRHTLARSAPERWLLNTLPHRLHADGRTRAPRRGRRVERQWCHSGKGERHGLEGGLIGEEIGMSRGLLAFRGGIIRTEMRRICALGAGRRGCQPALRAAAIRVASTVRAALATATPLLGGERRARNACWRPAKSRRSFVLQPLVRPHGTHTHVHTTNTRVASGGPSELNAR